MNIQASEINLIGGAGNGAYSAIVSQGNITLTASVLNLQVGSGEDADAVVISDFGLITAPSNCNGCLQLNASPMLDGGRSSGLYQGGQSAQITNPILVSTPLSQIDAVLDALIEEPDNGEERERERETEIVTEGQSCS